MDMLNDIWTLKLIKNNCKSFIFNNTACIFPGVPILDFAQSMGNLKEQIPSFKGHPVFLAESCCL